MGKYHYDLGIARFDGNDIIYFFPEKTQEAVYRNISNVQIIHFAQNFIMI